MRRAWKWVLLFVLLMSLAAKPPAVRPDINELKEKAKAQPTPPRKMTVGEIIKKLKEQCTLEKGIDNNTPLRDALEYIGDHYQILFWIDAQAFQEEGRKDNPIDIGNAQVGITLIGHPKEMDVTTEAVIRNLLSQVQPRATFLIRDGYVEITTVKKAAPENLLQQKVVGDFEEIPLEEVLKQLGKATGVSILFDPRSKKKAATPVTATLKNDVTLEAAVLLLADMAGLKVVQKGSALYVTTLENAAAFGNEEKKPLQPAKAK